MQHFPSYVTLILMSTCVGAERLVLAIHC